MLCDSDIISMYPNEMLAQIKTQKTIFFECYALDNRNIEKKKRKQKRIVLYTQSHTHLYKIKCLNCTQAEKIERVQNVLMVKFWTMDIDIVC